jgi:hypothetical protein
MRDPRVEFAEGIRAKRVEAFLPFGADSNETRLVQYAEVPRNSRLMDLDFVDEIVHRVLAVSKRLDDPQTHGVSQSLEDI